MKNLAEFYNLKCEKSVQPMGSTSVLPSLVLATIKNITIYTKTYRIYISYNVALTN